MVEARIDDERLECAVVAAEIELGALVAAFVDEDKDPPVRQEPPVNRLRQVGQLLDLPTLRRDPEELPDPRPVGSEQQRRAVGRERERPRRRQLEQLLQRLRQRRRRARG
jgi:hypothetical protein